MTGPEPRPDRHLDCDGWVLDTSAVLAAAVGTTDHARALVQTAVEESVPLAVPAAALAASWGAAGPAGRLFVDLLLDLPVTVVDALDAPVARAVGRVLDARGPLDLGHVVAAARTRGWPVVTAVPESVALAPDVEVEPLP